MGDDILKGGFYCLDSSWVMVFFYIKGHGLDASKSWFLRLKATPMICEEQKYSTIVISIDLGELKRYSDFSWRVGAPIPMKEGWNGLI